ncbi:uncharacterized protein [Amphiura filiformis]|uniref:uncharacterized protein isoform X1 n=1 Tax=Amphiura filiformis TaxID=82378 RepID=UPI003B222593
MRNNFIVDAMLFVVLLLLVLDITQIGASTLCDSCQGEECTECLQNAESNIQKRSCGDCRKKWQAYCQSCFIPGKRALQLPETGFYEDNRRDSGFDNILRAVEDNVADKIFKTYKTEADSKATSSSSQNFRFDYPKTKTFGSSDKCELDSIVRRLPPQWRQELVELIMLVSSSFSE